MRNQLAFGLVPRSVCIVSQLPVMLQLENKHRRPGKRIHTIRLGSVTIVVRRLASGEIVIVLEPP
jgi:hypothetical protein